MDVTQASYTTDKITSERVQRHTARYVKGVYIYDASVTQMLNKLRWESLESRREQFSIILYNILNQNVCLPPEHIPEFYLQTSQYQLQTRSHHAFRLLESFCNTDTYKYSFIPSTSRQWNLLPRHIFES